MSIRIETKKVPHITIHIEDDVSQDRLKVTFDDGDVIFFKPETGTVNGPMLILDIDATDDRLVEEALLPRPYCYSCGNKDCDAPGHTNKRFDIFSVISQEQYLQLNFVYLDLGGWYDRGPQVGEELNAMVGNRLSSGGHSVEIKPDRLITHIEVVSLDS